MSASKKTSVLFLLLLMVTLPRAPLAQEAAERLAIGIRLFEAGQLREAREVLIVAEKENPKDARPAYYLGRIAFTEGDYGKAGDWFEKATKAEPSDPLFHFWAGQAYGSAAGRANSIRQAMLARRIKSAFERAVALDPSYVDARFGLLQFYLQAPGVMGGSREKARAEVEEIERLSPWLGYLGWAQIHQAEKDTAAFERVQRDAVVAFPDSAQPYLALGIIYQQRGDYEQAFASVEQLLARDPGALGALYQIGRFAALSGQRLERGEMTLQDYLRREPGPQNPSHAAARWRLGMIYEHQGRPAEAQREYETALELDPKLEGARESLRRLKR
jgi:tetratricopeptide (TPR) repeat protein